MFFLNDCRSVNEFQTMDEENEYESTVDSKYYDVNQFNEIKPDIPSSFGLFHVNLASLKTNILKI